MADNKNSASDLAWQLVLTELERHNKWLNSIDEKINQALLVFSLEKQAMENIAEIVKDLDERVKELERDNLTIETIAKYKVESKKWKRWVVGLSIPAVTGLLIGVSELLTRTSS